MDIMKVARAQHKSLEKIIIEVIGEEMIPSLLQEDLQKIIIPFFQIIGFKIRFYILFQVIGDIYAVFEWASEDLPKKDSDVINIAILCKRFIIFKVCS